MLTLDHGELFLRYVAHRQKMTLQFPLNLPVLLASTMAPEPEKGQSCVYVT